MIRGRRKTRQILIWALTVISIAPSVTASTLFSTFATTTAYVLTGSLGPPPDEETGTSSASAKSSVDDEFGFAQGIASAGIGNLMVLAAADAFSGGNASATAEADFSDILTITGVGTGTFTIGAAMDAHCKTGTMGGNSSIFGSLTVNGIASVGSCGGAGAPVTIQATAGQTVFLSGQLSAGDTGELGGDDSDSGDPFQVFIEPLTPGVAYVAASGVVYATGVTAAPDPGSLVLTIGPIALLCMIRPKLKCTGPAKTAARACAIAAASLLFAGSSASASTLVSIGTTPLSGTSATLAIDFIDGDGIVNNSVLISSFQSDATLGVPILTGVVSGTIPGTVTLSDGGFFNELLLPLVLDSSISFDVDSTNVPGTPPDGFSLFLLDAAAVNSLVTTDLPGDALMQIQMDGTATNLVLPAAIDPAVTISIGSPVASPEPGSLMLSCGVLLPLAGLRRKWLQRLGKWTFRFALAGIMLPGIAPAQNLQPLDPDLQVTLSGIVFNRNTNTFDIQATLHNISPTTLTGPFSFVVTSITPASVVLANASCRTAADQPVIVSVFPSAGLPPGTNLTPLTLQFSNPSQVSFSFTQTVLAGDECATEDVRRDTSDGYPLPDEATLLGVLQLSQPILCLPADSPHPMTLPQALASIQQKLDVLAGPGALESFLASHAGQDPQQLSAWATAALSNQLGVAAIGALLAAHQNEPQNPMHLMNAGGLAASIGMPNEGLALLDAADALGGPNASPMGINGKAVAMNNRGFALSELGQWSQAQPYLTSAISQEPLLAEARLNLGVAYLCQGDSSTGEKYVRAGLHRSPGDLRFDQTYDLSAGVGPNMPPLPYPAVAEQLDAYISFYLDLFSQLNQQSTNLRNQSKSDGQQALANYLQNPPPTPSLFNQHLLDIGYAFGRIEHELWDDQTPPRLPSLWTNVLSNQQNINNLATQCSGQYSSFLAAEPPLSNTPAYLAWQARGRTLARGLLTQFLYTQGRYEQATRAFWDPWYRTLTGVSANISDPLYEQASSLTAQADIIDAYSVLANGAYGVLNPITAIWDLSQGPVEPASIDDIPNAPSVPPCPPELWGGHLTYTVLGFGVSANCDGVSASLDPGTVLGLKPLSSIKLPFVAGAGVSWKGDWTAFAGVKASGLNGTLSTKTGFSLSGEGTNITGWGFDGSFNFGKGPINLASGSYALSFGSAPHLGIIH
jgi:tetratricopeptide (TPR) repeat protein